MKVAVSHNNNMGLIRLVLALLVIVSHSPELIDGNRSREILTRVFGTLSFGELAVDGFFVASGYLITKSFVQSSTAEQFLWKRLLRIVPGYAVAYCFCFLLILPFSGRVSTEFTVHDGVQALTNFILLQPPTVDGVFPDTPYPVLNGAMWTISYEFRCYLLVLLAGIAGLLRRRSAILVTTFVLLALLASGLVVHVPYRATRFIGDFPAIVRFPAVFGCGVCFYLFRDRISYDGRLACVAALALAVLMFSHRLAEPSLAILGGYLLFWFAFHVRPTPFSHLDRHIDLSYGVYLYAWPVQMLFVFWVPGISPWPVALGTMIASGLLATLSWFFVEQPALQLKSLRLARAGSAPNS